MRSRLFSYILPVLLFNVIWGAVEFFVPVRYSDGDVSIIVVGLLFSVTSLISVLLDIPAGRLSDRVGRERLIALSMLITSVALLLLYFSTSLTAFIVSAILVGIAYGLNWSPLLAFVSDKIKGNNDGRVFGNFFFLSALGEAIAPLGIVLVVAISDTKTPFLILALIALACAGIFFRLIPSQPKKKAPAAATARFSYHSAWKLIQDDLAFNLFLFALGFFVAFFWESVWFTQPLIGFYENSLLDSALIVTAFALPTILLSETFGRLIDRWGTRIFLFASLGLVACAGLAFYMSPALILKIVFIFLAASGVLGVWLVLDVLAAKTQPPERRGEFFGILETVRDLSYAATPLIIGFVFRLLGLNGIFILASGLALVLLVCAYITYKKKKGLWYNGA